MARIIYFSRDYTSHDYRFLNALADTENSIFYLRLENRGNSFENRPLPSQINVIQWQGGLKPYKLSDFPKLLDDLKRVIQEIKPDLIQAGPLQSSAFLVAQTGYQPLVSTSWGYDLLIDVHRSFIHKWITKYVFKHSTIMVGDCYTIRQAAVALGMPNERIITFPWGVDLENFAPKSQIHNRQSWKQSFTLLSTRSWEAIYGVKEIAYAFVQACKQRPGLCLMMLGSGTLAPNLLQIFSEGNVLDQVILPGQISQVDLPAYYHQADLYISASHSDGTSISLLEALASALPVILSDIPGNAEWVMPGVHGWLFPTGNINSLANTMIEAFDQRHRLPDMGKACRQIAEQRADWNKNFPKLLDAYRLAIQLSSSN